MAGSSLLVIVGLLSAIEGTFGQGELEFSPPYGPFYPGCSVKATCVLTDADGRFTHWNTSGLGSVSCDIVLNHAALDCSNQMENCEPFTAVNEDTGDRAACRTSFLNFVMSIAINGTFIQCYASNISDELIQSTLTSPAQLVLQTPPSAPTLNPPLCSARDPASALVTVSWVDDGYDYTLDGAPSDCTMQNPCQTNTVDLTLQFSESYTLTVKAIDSPSSSCGEDLVSEGSVLDTNFAVLPLRKPSLELTLMRPEICNQDSSFKLVEVSASFTPLPPVLSFTDSGFDDIPCMAQYKLTVTTESGTNVSAVDSRCCEGDSCTCDMRIAVDLDIAEDSEFNVALVSNAQSEPENCPPTTISDIRRNCDIEFSYILDSKAGAMANVMCTGEEDCDFSIYNSTSNGSLMDQIPSGGARDFPIELMVNYSYEATCQLPASDDNCLQSVKYIGLFSADCGLESWCDGCNITNCFSTREDGCTAEFFNGLTVGSTATVSGMQCNTPESLLCGNDGSWTVEQTEGLSGGAIAGIIVAVVVIVIGIMLIAVGIAVLYHFCRKKGTKGDRQQIKSPDEGGNTSGDEEKGVELEKIPQGPSPSPTGTATAPATGTATAPATGAATAPATGTPTAPATGTPTAPATGAPTAQATAPGQVNCATCVDGCPCKSKAEEQCAGNCPCLQMCDNYCPCKDKTCECIEGCKKCLDGKQCQCQRGSCTCEEGGCYSCTADCPCQNKNGVKCAKGCQCPKAHVMKCQESCPCISNKQCGCDKGKCRDCKKEPGCPCQTGKCKKERALGRGRLVGKRINGAEGT